VKTDCDFGDATSDFMYYLDGFENLKVNEYFIRHQRLAINLKFLHRVKKVPSSSSHFFLCYLRPKNASHYLRYTHEVCL